MPPPSVRPFPGLGSPASAPLPEGVVEPEVGRLIGWQNGRIQRTGVTMELFVRYRNRVVNVVAVAVHKYVPSTERPYAPRAGRVAIT